MAKNQSEIPPQTSPPSDAGKEETRKLYEEVIAASKKSLKETRERTHIDQIKNEKKREEVYEKFIKPIEEEIAAKEAEMRRALSGHAIEINDEEKEAAHIKELRRRDEERRARKKEKKQEKPKRRGVSLEELRRKQFPQATTEEQKEEKEQKYPWEDEKKIQAKIKENEEIEQESQETLEELQTEIDALSTDYGHYQKEIKSAKTDAERDAALKDSERTKLLLDSAKFRTFYQNEGIKKRAQRLSAVEDLKYEFFDTYYTYTKKEIEKWDREERLEREKGSQEAWAPEKIEEGENQEGFEILEVPEEEFAPPSHAATPPSLEKKDEKKEKWPSIVARAIDKAFNKYEEAKYGEDRLRLNRLRNLQTDVEGMINTYQTAIQHEWPQLPEEESRLLRLKRGIENELASIAEKAPAPSAIEEPMPPPVEVHEVEPRKEPQTREEKIAAFRARREDLARKETGKHPYEISQELADFDTAGYYNFDIKKIDEAMEGAKRMQIRGERGYQNKVKTIETLERAKALIEKEIGIEVHEVEPRKDVEPLAEKTGEGIIEDMKSPEGVPPPAKLEKEPEKAPQKSKEKQYTEKDSVEGWKHYIAKEEERMRKEKPLTPQGEAMEAFIKREEEKSMTPPEGDRDALKRKLFPEQFREPRQEVPPQAGASTTEPTQPEQQSQQQSAGQAQTEARPAAGAPPTPEGATQESPEMGRAINELLGEELGGNAQMREAAAAVVEARRAMRGTLVTRKEERLYAEAGAGFIAPERLQEAERIEKAYEDALVGLSARMRESAGNNEEAFLVPYLNIQNAEAMRIAQMREAALTPERRSVAVRLYQRLNNPFNRDVPPRWARYVRVGLTAAVLGGGAAALGGVGAAGIAAYAGWRASKSLTFAAANGIARSGIDMALTRHADAMMGEERGKQRVAMQEALKNNERIEALQESLRASIRAFQGEAAAQLENRKFYGRAATFGLMGLSGLISYELARPSTVAADEGAFGGHIATNEDVLRQRFYETLGNVKSWGEEAERYVFGGKSSAEIIEDVIGKPSVGETAPSDSVIAPEGEREFGTPEEEAAALRRARGGLPPHQDIESVRGRMGGGARAAEILTDEQREEALKQYYGLAESAEKDRLAYLERKLTEGVILSDEQREEALKQYYGLIESAEKDRIAYLEKSLRYAPSDEWREEALKRYYGLVEAAEADRPPSLMTPEQAAQLHELQEKGVLTDDQIETLRRNWEGKPPLLDAEEIEKLQALREKGVLTEEQIDNMRKAWEGKLDALGKEPIATIGKSGNIWEASRSLIGEGEGKISKEQWLEAWEKSGLADKGFVKPGATVRFDAAEGLLKVSEAKDNEFFYQALQKEGKPIPGWLEDLRDTKEGRPSAAHVLEKSADQALARPAAPLEEIVETPVAGAKGGTFEQLLQNEEAQKYYVDSFGRHNFEEQEALLAEFKNAAKRLEENIAGEGVHSSVRVAYEQEVAQTKSFINGLENNAGYQGHLRAYEALVKEWVKKVVGDEAQFTELSNQWTVERFLDTAKKIENRDFVPSDQLSKILEARRMGTLEMAEEIRSKLPDRRALKMPLGRFLKNTL